MGVHGGTSLLPSVLKPARSLMPDPVLLPDLRVSSSQGNPRCSVWAEEALFLESPVKIATRLTVVITS